MSKSGKGNGIIPKGYDPIAPMLLIDTSLFKNLEKLAKQTDLLLWNAYDSAVRKTYNKVKSRLVFPTFANGKIRVSEQEARFFFIRALEDSPFLYSVETPTLRRYHQSGKSSSRASFDVTIRDYKTNSLLNCEFKFGGISPRRKSSKSVAKDLEKLLRDPGDGLWFHLLEAVDNSTLLNVLTIIARDIKALLSRYPNEIDPKSLVFHISVLRQHFSIHKEVVLNPKADMEASLERQLNFTYKVTRNAILSVQGKNEWRVFQFRRQDLGGKLISQSINE
ncbi:MAG: hypothetical protein N3G78_10635 [Desulfobacterota bacterium]|nr:hypothetical protein [Thermodesulfobacteriota bacterium]